MTREEAYRILSNGLFNAPTEHEWCIAFKMAIKALEQEPCEDAVSRQAVLEQINCWIDSGEYKFSNAAHYLDLAKRMRNISSVVSQPKIGWWVLAQRGKCIDINCSECGNTRIKEYAYGYTIDELDFNEINNLIAKNRMNYCECCGAKMEIKQGE